MSATDQAALSGMLAKMLNNGGGDANKNPEEQKNTGGTGTNVG